MKKSLAKGILVTHMLPSLNVLHKIKSLMYRINGDGWAHLLSETSGTKTMRSTTGQWLPLSAQNRDRSALVRTANHDTIFQPAMQL